MTTLFVCLWHNSRLNDSGLVGVYTTKELAMRGAPISESEGTEETPGQINWYIHPDWGIGQGTRGDVTYTMEPSVIDDTLTVKKE